VTENVEALNYNSCFLQNTLQIKIPIVLFS
jgi:hypothetical protein